MHLLFAGIASSFCILEFVGSHAPGVLPVGLLQYREELIGGNQAPPDFLEHLQTSPWVKLKPNTRVRTVGYGGGDFTADWITNSLGFKNLPNLAEISHVTAIAVGDSFVEGMGAAIPDVWTTLLTERGLTTYNLGVQGYAPQQLVGSLNLYGERFHPDFVIIGYTPGFEGLALVYANGKPDKGYAGGVGSMDQYVSERRRMAEHYKVTNAFFDLVSNAYQIARVKLAAWWSDARAVPVIERYRPEVEYRMTKRFDPESEAWRLAKKSILELKKLALKMGATPAVLIFSQRGAVYYEKLMGRPIPDSHYEMTMRRELKSFCIANGIESVDTLDSLKSYLRTLPESVEAVELPYWETDAHLSRTGNRIVADTVEKYLRTKIASAGF